MHEQTTIDIHEGEVPKLVYTLFCCKQVLWYTSALIVLCTMIMKA